MYILSLDVNFAPFLVDGFEWKPKSANNPNRGLRNDADSVPADRWKSASQKVTLLDLMLGQIANYANVVSRSCIVRQSTSLNFIWQKIREHYGLQTTGAYFLELANIKLRPGEKHEDLFQRLMAFYEDNLLTTESGISHHGSKLTCDEDLTPSLENTIVLIWLQLLHPGLPQLVRQRYGPDLRHCTLASLKPEISSSMSSLLDELHAMEESRVLRAAPPKSARPFPSSRPRRLASNKSCVLCKTAGRPNVSHFLSECVYLPEADKHYMSMARSRLVDDDIDQSAADDADMDSELLDNALLDRPAARRVDIVQSPYLNCFFHQFPVRVTLDTGATINMIAQSFAQKIGLPVQPASQMARQADGVTPLEVVGEVHCIITRGSADFQLNALVVNKLDVDILAGNPFLVSNDIATRPAKRQVVIGGSEIVYYGSQRDASAAVRRTQAFVLRAPPKMSVVLPGEYVELRTPPDTDPDAVWALEPRLDAPTNDGCDIESAWPCPQEIQSIGHCLRVHNNTGIPIKLRRSEHMCQIRPVIAVAPEPPTASPNSNTSTTVKAPHHMSPFSSQVSVDPDNCLSPEIRDKFRAANLQFDSVFNPKVPRYNGASGKIEAVVNMGPTLPPQRKGKLPSYNRDTMVELQNKFDELEAQGVFAKPEQVNVTVEYLNLSFLVKKPSGGTRLVTSFGEVGQYSKPSPSLMPNVDNVLRDIARWKYIAVTDLKQSFYQIPLAQSSMKYCGVTTPYKGIRVYTRSAMGMPGSETCLEELMSRVMGDFIQDGWVAKIADDLYVGGDTPEELLEHWIKVLIAMHDNNLGLNGVKTIICPLKAVILGWIWSRGTLQASPHRTGTLSVADPPTTVQGLRSFVGAYKALSRVLHGYAQLMDPLDMATAGKQSRDKIVWTEDLISAFRDAKDALKQSKVITMPRPDDILWVITDGSVKQRGIAATLYVLREGNILLAGFYNAKLLKHQVCWLPCEVEAISIGAAIKHFSPYIIQSRHQTQILTDSKPCVQAYQKLMRGEFSTSSRVTTFLSLASQYNVRIRHIAGVSNVPSDYASRNPPECPDKNCQVCKFVHELEEASVRHLSVSDVSDGAARMPFTNRVAWLSTQRECADLRRTHSHLSQGTRPTRKATKIKDVKRYLQQATVASDGVLVVPDHQPFQPSRERIVVPRAVINGLLTAIHIRFNHPTQHQLKKLVSRFFYALDIDKALAAVCDSCHHCMSLRSMPSYISEQSTSDPPASVGVYFSLDVMRRYRQYVLVLRESISAYTLTSLIANEQRDTLRDAVLTLCAELRSLGDHRITIKVDPAPGFASLSNDPILHAHGIYLEIGGAKNPNKNPIAEYAIAELGREYLQINPEGGPFTSVALALATANLNSRIRASGLSAREIWTQRDQFTGEQLPLEDHQLILQRHFSRTQNHGPSVLSKSHGRPLGETAHIQVGDLVYLRSDRDKCRARDKYLVAESDGRRCKVRKFTKSQFRNKVYELPVTECYPVQSNLPRGIPGGASHDLDETASPAADAELGEVIDQSNTESHHLPMFQRGSPASIDVPEVLSHVPEVISSGGPSTHGLGDDPIPQVEHAPKPPPIPPDPHVGMSEPETCHPRRSGRIRKPPTWQDNDWELY